MAAVCKACENKACVNYPAQKKSITLVKREKTENPLSPKKEKTTKMIRLTHMLNPDYKIITTAGEKKYIDWLIEECGKINAVPGRIAEIKHNDNELVSLWVNNVAA